MLLFLRDVKRELARFERRRNFLRLRRSDFIVIFTSICVQVLLGREEYYGGSTVTPGAILP